MTRLESTPHNTRRFSQRMVHRAARRERGFTLVEVVVALAIFVIGALAIIRIFPPALGVIQSSGSRSVALHINRTELETFDSKPDLVPVAVYDLDQSLSQLPDGDFSPIFSFPGAFVGDRITNSSIPDGIQLANISTSALSHFKYIRGEKHTVQSGPSGLFVLTRYPYDSAVPPHVAIEQDISGVELDSNGMLDFTNARDENGSAFSDAVNANPKMPPNDKRGNYYVSYSWNENISGTGTNIQGVIDEPIYIPANGVLGILDPNPANNPGATVLQAQRGAATIFKQSVQVHYRQAMSSAVSTTGAHPDVGYLPLTNSVSAGQTVSVDYQVQDWGLLVEDAQPSVNLLDSSSNPAAQEAVMQLPVKNLDDEANQVLASCYLVPELSSSSQFAYLTFDGINAGATSPDRHAIASPSVIPGAIQAISPSAAPTPTPPATTTNLQSGRTVFDATQTEPVIVSGTPIPLGAPQARIIYQTLDQWHHQLSVAAKSYVPFYTAPSSNDKMYTPTAFNPRERWREYYYSTSDGYLYFHASEAGKTIMVSFAYDTGSGYKAINGEIVAIGDDISQEGTACVTGFGGTTMVRAKLSLPDGSVIGDDHSPSVLKSILSVQGISVQTRTAWQEGTHFEQSVLSGYRPEVNQ